MENVKITLGKMPSEVERKHLGTETVDGRKTEKYRKRGKGDGSIYLQKAGSAAVFL